MTNVPTTNPTLRALIGHTFTYRADHPPYDPAADRDPGLLIVGNGMTMEVVEAWENWNEVPDLTIVYARCHQTGEGTHVTPDELGIVGWPTPARTPK